MNGLSTDCPIESVSLSLRLSKSERTGHGGFVDAESSVPLPTTDGPILDTIPFKDLSDGLCMFRLRETDAQRTETHGKGRFHVHL